MIKALTILKSNQDELYVPSPFYVHNKLINESAEVEQNINLKLELMLYYHTSKHVLQIFSSN